MWPRHGFLLLLACCLGQAQAGETALEQCVQQARNMPPQQMACIGLQQDICLHKRGSDANLDMAQCADEETKIWQSMMNQAQASLLANEVDPIRANLVAVQDQWNAYVEGYCQYRMDRWGRGSGAITDGALCYMNATALRAIDLMADAGWPAN